MFRKILITIAVMSFYACNAHAAISIQAGDFNDAAAVSTWWHDYTGTWPTGTPSGSSARVTGGQSGSYASYYQVIDGTASWFMNVDSVSADSWAGVSQNITSGFTDGDNFTIQATVVMFNGGASNWGQAKLEFYTGAVHQSAYDVTTGAWIGPYDYPGTLLTVSGTVPTGLSVDKIVVAFEAKTNSTPSGNASMMIDNVQAVPEPSVMFLFGSGLLGLLGAGWRRFRSGKQ